MAGGSDFFADMPMLELFRIEMEQQASTLSNELLTLEKDSPELAEHLATLMRAAHSIKGAARLVDRKAVVTLAHVLEDCFVQAQNTLHVFSSDQVDILLAAVDTLHSMARDAESDEEWLSNRQAEYDQRVASLTALDEQLKTGAKNEIEPAAQETIFDFAAIDHAPDVQDEETTPPYCEIDEKSPGRAVNRLISNERVVRISSRQLDRLMALTGEFMMQSRFMRPYTDSLRRLKRDQAELVTAIEELREQVRAIPSAAQAMEKIVEIQQRALACRDATESRVVDFESYDVKGESLSSRLRSQVVSTRMRPFRDGVQGLPRIVRDVARSLGKEIDLQMTGLDTLVDRDILERMEAPLSHLLNNAIDHGIEAPDIRRLSGKPAKGTIKLSAFHHGGMLYVLVEDDGKGIDFDRIRHKVVQKGLVKAEVAESLTQQEVGEFMFLPGFSTKDEVTSLSGRGVGLDVVQDVMQEMRGAIEVSSQLGFSTQFKMRFPLTLSVVPSLLVDIGEEPYAFPMARVDQILRISQSDVIEKNGESYFSYEGNEISLISTASLLDLDVKQSNLRVLSILMLSTRDAKYGFLVDRFLKEGELIVHVMPSQIERIQDISSVALMDDGMPVFIIDVDDLLRSTKKMLEQRAHRNWLATSALVSPPSKKRVLVVDDSITVREIERKILQSAGFDVEVAVDGMEGWNAVRNNLFDLVVTDVDMPRLNGLQLLNMIKQDPGLTGIPVIVISYKDRQEDQERAIGLGADLFIAKANFHDETFKDSVARLIEKGGAI